MIFHKIILSSLVAFQILGPSWSLVLQTSEAFAQDNSNGQVLIAGLRGVVTVTPGMIERPGYAPNYRSSLGMGDVITTEEESVAELLFENQGLLTVQEYSEAKLGKQPDGGLSVNLQIGAAEWSLPLKGSSRGSLTLSTPNIRATTNGGLITAEVQPTLSETAKQSLPEKSFLVRASLRAQSNMPSKVALLETFCVKEGDLRVEYPGTQSGVFEQKEVPAGQCVGFFNGALRAMGDEYQIADWRAICAVGPHCDIPESAKKLIAKKQMKQALALEEALLGSDPDEGEVDEDIILATTRSLAGDIQGRNGPSVPFDPEILPCTGSPELCGGSAGVSPEPNIGGTVPLRGAGGSGAPPMAGTNVQTLTTLLPAQGVSGGNGSLLFLDSNFTADRELLMVDSGIKADAPHMGVAPTSTLVISSLTPIGGAASSNQRLPLNFSSFNQPESQMAQLGVEGPTRESQAQQLAEFAWSPSINPTALDDILLGNRPAEPCSSLLDCFEVVLALGEQGTLGGDPEPGTGIGGRIQARSSSTGTDREVVVKSGVVLVNTSVSLAPQQNTSAKFAGTGAIVGTTVQSSALSFLGKPGEPAIVRLEDRALALLDGSRLQPVPNQTVPTTLLAIVDSQLTGPQSSPVIGKDGNGNDIVRSDIPPIIEIIDSTAEVETAVVVVSTAAAGQDGVLDQTLLEASAPLLAMIRGTLDVASDFGQIGGKNAKLVANLVSGDALVRLAASNLIVDGNMFNVTGGGQLLVTDGALLSLQGGSNAFINGVFVSVSGAGSLFSLTNGSLVDFGSGINTVNVTNSLCGGGGCFAPFSDPTLLVAGDPANFSAPAGFNPFVGAGTFTDGSVNAVNVAPGSAILEVQNGGTIQIQ